MASHKFEVTEGYRRYVIWLLFVVVVLNFVDRQILTILIEPIKNEFAFSDTQLGLLGGLAFALLYSTLGIPIARWADRKNRVSLISLSLFVWSLFTALTGFAQSFSHFLIARVAVGVGEAGLRVTNSTHVEAHTKPQHCPQTYNHHVVSCRIKVIKLRNNAAGVEVTREQPISIVLNFATALSMVINPIHFPKYIWHFISWLYSSQPKDRPDP